MTNDDPFAILADSRDRIWIGTPSGLFLFEKDNERFRKIEEFRNYFVYDLLEDESGTIWAGTYNDGLFMFNPNTEEIRQFIPDPSKSGTIPHQTVIDLYEDSEHTLWIATAGGGFAKFNKSDQTFTSYTIEKDFLQTPILRYWKMISEHFGLLLIKVLSSLIQILRL